MTGQHTSSATESGTTASEPSSDAPLTEAGREAGATATRLAEQATDVALDRADQGRRQAAEGIDQLAGSFRRVSSDIETDQPSIAGLASTAAEQADRFASYLQQTDARRLISDVEDMARRQPILFLGGAFVLGLAVSRFLKAGSVPQPGTDRYGSRIGATTPRAVGPGADRYAQASSTIEGA